MRYKVLAFIGEVILAGIASWGSGKVADKIDSYFSGEEPEEEAMLSEGAHIVITCGMELISEKFAEYVRARDNLERETERQKFGRAKYLSYHVECARRDLDLFLLNMKVACDTEITEEFLDVA